MCELSGNPEISAGRRRNGSLGCQPPRMGRNTNQMSDTNRERMFGSPPPSSISCGTPTGREWSVLGSPPFPVSATSLVQEDPEPDGPVGNEDECKRRKRRMTRRSGARRRTTNLDLAPHILLKVVQRIHWVLAEHPWIVKLRRTQCGQEHRRKRRQRALPQDVTYSTTRRHRRRRRLCDVRHTVNEEVVRDAGRRNAGGGGSKAYVTMSFEKRWLEVHRV